MHLFFGQTPKGLGMRGLRGEKKHVLKRKIFAKSDAFRKKQYFHSSKQLTDFPSNEVKT